MRDGLEGARLQSSCSCSRNGDDVAFVNGVRVDAFTESETIRRLEGYLECPSTHIVNHLAAPNMVQAGRHEGHRAVLNRADMNLPDGMGVVWACRIQGFKRTARVYGPEFLLRMVKWGETRGMTHAFVGGTPESLPRMIAVLRSQCPSLQVAGAHAPPVREVSHAGVVEDLGHLACHADMLWVGLGSPKQQVWADLARSHHPAKVIITVGAAFDFIAGTKRQAPKWLRNASLEWVFRVAMEPRRLWRRIFLADLIFAGQMMRELLRLEHKRPRR
jgi:N-acetylglucosaminyldiphosphoundecaprenol N-acetyl-beta-D-mannosaminyltransferase